MLRERIKQTSVLLQVKWKMPGTNIDKVSRGSIVQHSSKIHRKAMCVISGGGAVRGATQAQGPQATNH